MNKLIQMAFGGVLLIFLSCKSEKIEQMPIVTLPAISPQTKRPFTLDDYQKISSLKGINGHPSETLIGNCKFDVFKNEKLSETYSIFFESSYSGFRLKINDWHIILSNGTYTVSHDKDFRDSLIFVNISGMQQSSSMHFMPFKYLNDFFDLKGVDSVYEEKSSVCDGVFWLTRCTNPADSNFLQELPYYEAKVEYSMKYITAYEFRSKDKFNNVRRVVVDIDYDYDKMYEELDPKLFDITEYVEFTPKGDLILAEKYRKRGFRLVVQ